MVGLPVIAHVLDALGFFGFVKGFVGLHGSNHFFKVAAEHDVGTAPCHVGGNGNHAWAASLHDDVGFAGVLFGVEHLMRQVGFLQKLGDDF